MDKEKLNAWAADFIGEPEELVAQAVESNWYTDSPSAAVVVLLKMAEEGKSIELSISGGEVEVECGECEEEGKLADLATLILTACYKCHVNS